jgi:hypothetical protein
MNSLLALFVAAGSIAGALALNVAADLLGDELKPTLRSLARSLVQHSASRLPAGLQDRYSEEWGAEVEHIIMSGRTLKALKFALDLRLRGARGVRDVARTQRIAEPASGATTSAEPQPTSTPVITLHPELTRRPSDSTRDWKRIQRDLELVHRDPPRIPRNAPQSEHHAPRSGWKWS